MKIAILCGGPSLERGISLNSARSVMDHLSDDTIEIIPVYFDHKRRAFKISKSQLYSNTPSDFDFKLKETAVSLTDKSLIKLLEKVDIVFPVMHGVFGEDGTIQSFLEKNNIPFIGTGSVACKRCFDKYFANEFIKSHDFFTLPSTVLKIYHDDHREIIEDFFKKNKIKRAIVKPATGGSSIGVFSVTTVKEALEKASHIFSKRMDTRVVIEEFAKGNEFTVIILESKFGLPVAILPTEIETDYSENQVFDYRRKYLPTRQVTYHCPPRFSNEIIEKIQVQAEQLFKLLGMRDFARFDGWLLPDGNIWFSDFNPISGMEQNSFLFQQGSRVGFTHQTLLRYILKQACDRYKIKMPELADEREFRKPVNVIFGGGTSERQVSLMSGTNVWLKLEKSKRYKPEPCLLDCEGNIWKLPYALTLNHTVEEIVENCQKAELDQERLQELEGKVMLRLALNNTNKEPFFIPKKMTLEEFAKSSRFVFIGLHGGDGEDGTLQNFLEQKGVRYNGPDSTASRICMNKFETGELIRKLKIPGLGATKQKLIKVSEHMGDSEKVSELWRKLTSEFSSKTLIVKPINDGCSSGIVHLFNSFDLECYLELINVGAAFIPKRVFKNQEEIIEMPSKVPEELLIEEYIPTDTIEIRGNKLYYREVSDWIEVTVGLIETRGKLKSLNSSLTVAEGELLSVEEKFQGGTGVNITPPPETIISKKKIEKVKGLIEKLGEAFKIKGYARVDAFVNIKNGNVIIIEINTLPGLTPSTVIFHQALAEKPQVYPLEFLETLIENKGY